VEGVVCVSMVGRALIFCRNGKRTNREDLNQGTLVAA